MTRIEGSDAAESQIKNEEVRIDHDKLVDSGYAPVAETEQFTTNDATNLPTVAEAGHAVHERTQNVCSREDEVLRLPENHFADFRQSVIDFANTLAEVEQKAGRVVLHSREFELVNKDATPQDVLNFLASIRPLLAEDDRRQA